MRNFLSKIVLLKKLFLEEFELFVDVFIVLQEIVKIISILLDVFIVFR